MARTAGRWLPLPRLQERRASTAPHLERWCEEHGWDKVLNRAGTTFRKLSDAHKADLDQAKAIDLMLAQPSMIKRPGTRPGRTQPWSASSPSSTASAFA